MPVVKGRVLDFNLRELAVGVGEQDMGDFAAIPPISAIVNAFLASSFGGFFGLWAGRLSSCSKMNWIELRISSARSLARAWTSPQSSVGDEMEE